MIRRYSIIYSLSCPLDGKGKYIGSTEYTPQRRASEHFRNPSKNVKPWIDLLKSKNLCPVPKVLQRCLNYNALDNEKKWVEFYENNHYALLNVVYTKRFNPIRNKKHHYF